GLAHRLDLLGRKGRCVSSRPIFSCNSSISIVASPSFWRRRASARSWLSSGGFFSASWPASRNASRQVVRRAAGSPRSRDTRSSGSPRNSRRTTSVFCRAENRWGFCQPLVLPSPVALRAPCAGSSMDNSCGCIWTPPLSDYTQIGVQFNCTPNQLLPTCHLFPLRAYARSHTQRNTSNQPIFLGSTVKVDVDLVLVDGQVFCNDLDDL